MSFRDYYRAGASVGVTARVGDILILPGEFRAQMLSTNAYVLGLVRDIADAVATNPTAFTANWRASWTDFVGRWDAFYRAMAEAGFSVDLPQFEGMHGPRNMLLSLGEEAKNWARELIARGGRRTQPQTAPPSPSPPFEAPDLNPLHTSASMFTWALLGVGALVAVTYLRRGG